MRTSLLLTIAVGVCITAAPGQDKRAKSDVERLQGAWALTSYEDADEKAPDKDLKGWTYAFKGNKIVETRRGETGTLGSFSLNEGKKPREIDILIDGGIATGIYELDGERLTIRIYFSGVARPKAIKGALNKRESRIELKRQKSSGLTDVKTQVGLS